MHLATSLKNWACMLFLSGEGWSELVLFNDYSRFIHTCCFPIGMAVAVAWCHGAHLLLLLFPLLQTEMQDRLMERDEHSRALGCPGLLCL